MCKRILSAILVAVMLFAMLPATALAAEAVPTFNKVNMTLNGVLNVNFKLNANGADMSQYHLRVTIGDNPNYQRISTFTEEDGLCVYVANLVVHRMYDTVTAALYKGDTQVSTKQFKVADYVDQVKQLDAYKNNTQMLAMLDTMLDYGTYAAYYGGRTQTKPNVAAVENVTAADVKSYVHSVIVQPADNSLGAVASLYLDKACDLLVKFNAQAFQNHKLFVNGKQVELETVGSQAVYEIAELLPQNWDNMFIIRAENAAGETVFEVHYSVLSYAYLQISKETEIRKGLNGMLKAMYLYHRAVETYASQNGLHDAVVTPNTDLLFENGEGKYIFMFDTQNTDVKAAVDFINTQFETVAGKKLSYPGTTDPVNWDETKKYIVVGNHTMFANAGLSMPLDDLGDTGFYIITKGKSVFIMANEGADEAQAYQQAALAFLKHVLGYEMYAVDCATYNVADVKNITLPSMRIVEKPDIDYRNKGNYISVGTGSYGMGYTNNSIFMSVDGEVYHTALKLLDPDTYYSRHKSWFRRWDMNDAWFETYYIYQLCYTTILNDTSAMDIIYNNLKSAVMASDLNTVSFGPADSDKVCDCSKCNAAGATASYIKVTNALAERLAADEDIDRTVKVIAFAYRQYKTAPTGVAVNPNVGVMVAPIEASYNTPIRSQTEYADNIKAWSNLTEHLYLWFYQANFDNFLYPIDSWDSMQDNIKFAREVGADYLFYQGGSNAAGTAFSKLKDYLEVQLMKNANADYTALVNNFFNTYYGPAADTMLTYFNALQAHMNSKNLPGTYKEEIATTANWPQAKLQEFMGYIDAAYNAVAVSGSADAGVYNSRIRAESLFPRFALLSLYNDTAAAGAKNGFVRDCQLITPEGQTFHINEATALTAWDNYSSWLGGHTCSFTNEVKANKYLKSCATATAASVYYKSCSCGAVGTETFEGEMLQAQIVDTEFILEAGTGTVTYAALTAGTAKVTIGQQSQTLEVTNGTVTLDMSKFSQAAMGKLESVAVENGGKLYNFTNVWHVTKAIRTFADLSVLNSVTTPNLDGYYILANDIDANNGTVAAGQNNATRTGFKGVLDGRGFTIANLNQSGVSVSGWPYTGLFGRVNGGTIKNITFEALTVGGRGTLFGRHMENVAGGDKAVVENVTVNIQSWVNHDSQHSGVFTIDMLANTIFTNVVINVAPGLDINNLLGKGYDSNTVEGSITVNLGIGTNVALYYDESAEAPSIMTVKQKVAQEIADEVIFEGNSGTIINSGLTAATAAVSINGHTETVSVSDGSLSLDVSRFGVAYGKLGNVVVECGDATYTYTNVLRVTQIIDTLDELKAFSTQCHNATTAAGAVSGYYLLGADIDCGNAGIATGGGAWNGGFSGIFDGRNHKIKNLNTANQGGIFSRVTGTVQNVHFENVAFASNAALFGKTTENAVFQNVTVDVASWVSVPTNMTYAGILGVSSNKNSTFDNFVINVADGVSVSCLLGREFTGAKGSITVNLASTASVVNYYTTDGSGNNCVTALPADSIITVIQKIEQVIDTEVIIEGNTWTQSLTAPDGAVSVSFAGQTLDGDVASNVLTVDLTQIAPAGKLAENAVVTVGDDTYTYTNVWHVTGKIDDAAELKALAVSGAAAYVEGYYILAGDIDCSGYTSIATNVGWSNGFAGTFDGRNYTIKGINMAYRASNDVDGDGLIDNGLGGLFGKLAGATIKDTKFVVTNMGANGALLANVSGAYNNKNVLLDNLTVTISNYNSAKGVLIGEQMQATKMNGVTINVGENVTVGNLLSAKWYPIDNDVNTSANGTLTVNLALGSTIANYDGTKTLTVKPDFITVNKATYPAATGEVNTLVAGEGTTTVTFTHEAFVDRTTGSVTINGRTLSNQAITDGKLTVDLASFGESAMGKYSALVTTNGGDNLTYTDVYYVTQVIDDATELKALGTKVKTENVAGYYILGGDIDCLAEANMASGYYNQTTAFTGTFDGRGKSISNITQVWQSNDNMGYGGLFGRLNGATIKNVVFTGVNAKTNSSLLARFATSAIVENIRIDVSVYSSAEVLFFGWSCDKTQFNDVTVNIANGVTVARLLSRNWTTNPNGNGNMTIVMNGNAAITNYYGDSAPKKPEFITVRNAGEALNVTVNTLVAGEGSKTVTITNNAFNSDTVEVTLNNQTKSVAASNDTLALNLDDFGVTDMGQYSATVKVGIDTYTYTDVYYVTKVIHNVTELKNLGASCFSSLTGGYYILGGDVDCTGQSMVTGNTSTTGFTGVFDGRGFAVKNITTVYDGTTGGYGGLFARLAGCTIKNTTFDKIQLGTNGTLFGRHTVDAVLKDLIINVSSYNTTEGLLAGMNMTRTSFDNVEVNIANGVTISKMLCRDSWVTATDNGKLKVNLTGTAAITYYYGTTAAKPDFITLN